MDTRDHLNFAIAQFDKKIEEAWKDALPVTVEDEKKDKKRRRLIHMITG